MSHTVTKGHLYTTVKCARAGGSTLAREWVRNDNGYWLNEKDEVVYLHNPRVIVDADFIRESLHGHLYIHLAEESVFTHYHLMIRMLLNSGHDVWADSTNSHPSSLRKLFSIDPDMIVTFVNTPENICVQRAHDSGQSDLVEKGVIKRMWSQIVALANSTRDYHEGLWTGTNLNAEQMQTFETDVYRGIEKIRKEVISG